MYSTIPFIIKLVFTNILGPIDVTASLIYNTEFKTYSAYYLNFKN